MRIDVKKILFIGLNEEKDNFFRQAQQAGLVHFIDSSPTSYKHVPEDVERVIAAIKVVRTLPVQEQEEVYPFDKTDQIVGEILSLRETIDKRDEQIRIYNLEIARVEIFGNFSTADIAYIESEGHRKIQFFCATHGTAEELASESSLIHVGTESGLDYFVSINSEPRQYPGLIEMKIDKPLGTLTSQLRQIQTERRDAEARLKKYARYEDFLHEALKEKLNRANLKNAEGLVQEPMEGALFAISGWVPSNKSKQLDTLLQQTSVHAEEIAIEENDPIPTYLENHGARRIGEDLVHIYDTPSHTDKDPSLWVLCFFALFFAMIVGDAGYGLVFLGASLYIRTKYSHVKGTGRRVMNLLAILSVACILWGITNASFFGISLASDNPLRQVSLLTWLAHKKAAYHINEQDHVHEYWVNKNQALKESPNAATLLSTNNDEGLAKLTDNVFLEVVLLLAVVHIILSLLRYLPRNWASAGWIIFLVGAVLYVPFKFVDAVTVVQYVFGLDVHTAMDIGIQLITVGFVTAVVLSLIQNRLLGLLEPMTVIQIFSDVMSYLRLYALGLAGAIVSGTLNEMFHAVPFAVGVVLILLGHALNMVLAIAGGIIHGLRLNFLEWYHYSFVGGGRLFKPLNLLEVAKRED
ncbi:MAG: V-type ATPase 116kDa subunit family protein [Chlamydiales bacterium]|nr:V-type ATPase 116kDa subunit family protein [Chlamydiales bacterium]